MVSCAKLEIFVEQEAECVKQESKGDLSLAALGVAVCERFDILGQVLL